AKEMVAEMLRGQRILAVNPAWTRQVARLIKAVELLRRKAAEGARVSLPEDLQSLLTSNPNEAWPRDRVIDLLPTLLANVDAIREVLRRLGEVKLAGLLLSGEEMRGLDVFNPHLREMLQAASDMGFLIVIHNDFGLAPVLGDGRMGEAVPDERYGMPLLGLLAQYPRAKVTVAHLGVG